MLVREGDYIDDMKRPPYLWQHKTTGYFYVIFYDDPFDRKRRETLKTKDKRIAEDRFYLWREQRTKEETLGISQAGITIGDAVSRYLQHKEQRAKAVSVKRYKNALDNVLNFIGADLPLIALKAADLQDYQIFRIAKTDKRTAAKKGTVDHEVSITRAFLNWCLIRKWVLENVASSRFIERLVRKTDDGREKRIFSDQELDLLMTPQEDLYWQLPYIFSTLYFTGMRIGEISHLTVKDLDWKQMEIRVREKTMNVPVWDRSTNQNISKTVDWTPKWYRPRNIPIDSRLEPILREFHSKRLDNIFGLYFYSARGNQITDHVSRQIQRIVGKADVSVHAFRHTHISHALNRWGRNPSVVQEWVGHKDLRTTMKYVHVDRDDLHREALKIGE